MPYWDRHLVSAPLDDETALTRLVLHEAAIKLAYTGHCGRPGP